LVEMPYLRKTVRHVKEVPVEYDVDLFNKVVKRKWHVYENRPLRDVSELFAVMRKVVNSDSSRLEAIRGLLLSTHPRLIVFYNFDYELEMLRTLSSETATGTLTTMESRGNGRPTEKETKEAGTKSTQSSTSLVVAEWNGHRHDPVPKGDRWIYLVQYAAGAEGWNCTTTNAMVFYSLPYSYKMWHQAHGRIDRLDTPYTDLYYYVLKSSSVIDKAIAKALEEKRNFNESAYYRAK